MLIISYLPYLLLRRLDHSDGKHPRKIHILAYLNTSFIYFFCPNIGPTFRILFSYIFSLTGPVSFHPVDVHYVTH